LNVGSVSCVVGDVAGGVDSDVDYRVSWSINCSVGSEIDRLYYFIFTSSLFSYWLKGAVTTVLLVRMFRYAPRVRTYGGSAISMTSFFDLGGGDTDISLKTSYRWRILEVV
jgi:hypothetical protein